MSTLSRTKRLAALLLLGASAFASAHPAQPGGPTEVGLSLSPDKATPPGLVDRVDRVRIGLSDSDTQLILPWFVTELADGVNERKSLEDVAKGLARGV
ncbi:hypothetical protein [Pandoraea pnomenusa]|uniref:hypothetical protein n=1 Tax=Pandoraea pnomenusa TaxID=93220 RepID=UPI0033429887